MIVVLSAAAARADDAGWVDLSSSEALPSALVDDPASPEPPTPRARWGVRPSIGVIGLPGPAGGWGASVGGQLTHQWWMLTKAWVRPVGETQLRVAGLAGSVGGWRVDVDTAAGVWLGPVGVLGGAMVRVDRYVWTGGAALPAAVLGGAEGRLAVKAGPVTPWVAASPGWLIVGDRPQLRAPWSEFRTQGGASVDLGNLELRLAVAHTATAVGGVWDAALGFHLTL
jgi:hypothetical protein